MALGSNCSSLFQGACSPLETDSIPLQEPTHLIVLVHGLWGGPEDWHRLQLGLQAVKDRSILVLVSNCNNKVRTFSGIDVCGRRLASEISDAIAKNPRLTRISLWGHSLGGLIARYAVGVLYAPETGLLGGLVPCHFLTLATPHAGCSSKGLSQLPLLSWVGRFPLLGSVIQSLASLLVTIASYTLGSTGKQLFLQDHAETPLLQKMCLDHPEDKLFFHSGLAAFASRTCYANIVGDHLIAWANGTVRYTSQLPTFEDDALRRCVGVAWEEPLSLAFQPHLFSGTLQTDILCQASRQLPPAPLCPTTCTSCSPTGPSHGVPLTSFVGVADAVISSSDACEHASLVLARLAASHTSTAGGTAASATMQVSDPWPQPCAVLATTAVSATDTGIPATGVQSLPSARVCCPSGTANTITVEDASAAAPGASGRVQPLVSCPSSSSSSLLPCSSLASLPECLITITNNTPGGSSSSTQDGQGDGGEADGDREDVVSQRGGPGEEDCGTVAAAEADSSSLLRPYLSRLDVLCGPIGAAWKAKLLHRSTASIARTARTDAEQQARLPGGGDVGAGGRQLSAPGAGPAALADWMVGRLQLLPWRRVDVCFMGAWCGSAHCNIQYNSFMNFAGRSVTEHVVRQLLDMEDVIQRNSTLLRGSSAHMGNELR